MLGLEESRLVAVARAVPAVVQEKRKVPHANASVTGRKCRQGTTASHGHVIDRAFVALETRHLVARTMKRVKQFDAAVNAR